MYFFSVCTYNTKSKKMFCENGDDKSHELLLLLVFLRNRVTHSKKEKNPLSITFSKNK